MLIRPATSLIGVKSGSVPFASLIVSYAIAVIPDLMTAFVKCSSAAKWK
jgi:hypothetical protein